MEYWDTEYSVICQPANLNNKFCLQMKYCYSENVPATTDRMGAAAGDRLTRSSRCAEEDSILG